MSLKEKTFLEPGPYTRVIWACQSEYLHSGTLWIKTFRHEKNANYKKIYTQVT